MKLNAKATTAKIFATVVCIDVLYFFLLFHVEATIRLFHTTGGNIRTIPLG